MTKASLSHDSFQTSGVRDNGDISSRVGLAECAIGQRQNAIGTSPQSSAMVEKASMPDAHIYPALRHEAVVEAGGFGPEDAPPEVALDERHRRRSLQPGGGEDVIGRGSVHEDEWECQRATAAKTLEAPVTSWFDYQDDEHRASGDCRFAAIQFARWAACRWDRLHDLFNMDSRLANVAQRCSVSEADFLEYLRRHAFDGDGSQIFRSIIECSSSDAPASGRPSGNSNAIRLPQFLRFQRYASALAAPVLNDQLQSFVNALRKQRGTVLRAWRVDLDRHAVGRITSADLASACRQLKLSTEARAVWIALRGNEGVTAPLKLAELAPDEAANVDHFAEVLWTKFGFDLEKAWARIDTGRRGLVSFDEFSRGLRKMRFEGDARLLFRGLDATGLGRLRHGDFEYLHVLLSPCMKQRGIRRGDVDPDISSLISWVQEEMNGHDKFLERLDLLPVGRSSPRVEIPTLSVKELCTRLQELRFPGDSLHVAVLAARTLGGAKISSESLLSLISGKPAGSPAPLHIDVSDMGSAVPSPLSPRFRNSSLRASSAGQAPRKVRSAWDGGMHNPADFNVERSKNTRNYFSVPERGVPLRGSVSYASSAASSPTSSPMRQEFARSSPQKTNWDSGMQDFTMLDTKKSPHARLYFSSGDCARSTPSLTTSSTSSARKGSSGIHTHMKPVVLVPGTEMIEGLPQRVFQDRSRQQGRQGSHTSRARSLSATRSVGPFASASRRVTGGLTLRLGRQTQQTQPDDNAMENASNLGGPRPQPGDDSSDDSYVDL